ncbi:MAG: hypothetical protein RSC43_07710, partial [Clostridia bacterium]
MGRFSQSAAPPLRSVTLERFRGIDLKNNALNVAPNRSPDACNIIAGPDGFPVCRDGYHTIKTFVGAINGVFTYRSGEKTERVIHHGTKISKWDGTELYTGVLDAPSSAFNILGKLYILDGLAFVVYDGTTVKRVRDIAYAPTIAVGCTPDGRGTKFEDINLIGTQRIKEFKGDGTSQYYMVDTSFDDISAKVKVEVLNANGDWKTLTMGLEYNAVARGGFIEFYKAYIPPFPPVAGMDNVRITYPKTIEENAERIEKCTIMTLFGMNGGADTIFVSGNPKLPNYDWHSAINQHVKGGITDPTYYPDLSYAVIGQDTAKIMGYSSLGDGTIAIHKEQCGGDSTMFYRSAATLGGISVFPVRQGARGIAPISKRCITTVHDEPLMLTAQGVVAIEAAQNLATAERRTRGRSYYIDPQLTTEANLDNAVAIEFLGKYYLAINGRVYVADSSQLSIVEDEVQFEWYLWDNIPVYTWFEDGTQLLFGTKDGRICEFWRDNTDDKVPVNAYWKTPLFDFAAPGNYKVIKSVTIVPCEGHDVALSLDYLVG